MVETNEIIEIDLNHILVEMSYIKEFQLCRNLTGEVLSTVIQRSYIDHLKEGTMNSGTVKDVRTIDLTDDDDDTSGNQNGNMEWKNETIFHFQHPPSV